MERGEEVFVVETVKLEAKKPTVIVGFPDVGLVGSITAHHIVETLKMEEVGYVDAEFPPPVMVIHESEPKVPMRIYGMGELAVILADIPVTPTLLYPLAKTLVGWAKSHNASLVIGVSGIAVPNRMNIDQPAVFGIGTTKEARETLTKMEIALFGEGFVAGTYALLMKECMRVGQNNITLLAESHYEFPDPGAAASAINVLNRLLHLQMDAKPLIEKAEEIRIRSRDLMRDTQQQMGAMQKFQEREVPSVYV